MMKITKMYSRLRDLREDSDKTQAEVAEYLGTTAQYYGKYEQGKREIPFCRVIELAELYNVSLDYIAERTKTLCQSTEGLTEDSLKIAQIYERLSERDKGKLELFAEQLMEHKVK